MKPSEYRRYVITLARRPDRLEQFAACCPLSDVSPVYGVDSTACQPPRWWRGPLGAWGCYRSHVNIIEHCLNAEIEQVTIFEDDAVPCEDFQSRYDAFMSELPHDWGIAYLGGELLYARKQLPARVTQNVYRPFNVNRTHAYMVHRRAMLRVYKHLCDFPWDRKHHVDHWLGKLHEQSDDVYCPARWLFSQRGGDTSDVDGRVKDMSKLVSEPKQPEVISRASRPTRVVRTAGSGRPPVIVIGLHRSGSSCLAGVLARLGVYMGRNFRGYEQDGGHEDGGLAHILETWMPFPGLATRVADGVLAARLRRWYSQHRLGGDVVGLKYPHLCMVPVREIWPDATIIHASRPLEESVESLVRRCPKKDPLKLATLQNALWDAKQELVQGAYTVEYSRLLADSVTETSRLCEYLKLDGRLVDEAAAYVLQRDLPVDTTASI
jgi:hypothetical protein